jgi:hypothetical protein
MPESSKPEIPFVPAVLTKQLFIETFEAGARDAMEVIMQIDKGIRGTVAALPPCIAEPKYALHPKALMELVEKIGFYHDWGGSENTPEVAMGKLHFLYCYQYMALSSRYGRSHPWMLWTGMSKWEGAINDEGILVAYSGQSGRVDELISRTFSSGLKGACQERFQNAFEDLPGVLIEPLKA